MEVLVKDVVGDGESVCVGEGVGVSVKVLVLVRVYEAVLKRL